jgi:hypothetical protein
MMLVLASPAFGAPGGQGKGIGIGIGGDIAHDDDGKKTRNGGGPLNNPSIGCFTC